jgi:hypothetical protein
VRKGAKRTGEAARAAFAARDILTTHFAKLSGGDKWGTLPGKTNGKAAKIGRRNRCTLRVGLEGRKS